MESQVSLGPLTRTVTQGARWAGAYPSTQAWADECEQLLDFAQSQGVLDEYLPRLQGSDRQRDAALAEIRVARYFSLNGCRPLPGTWQPNGGQDSDGEFVIQGARGSRVRVEVKHRDWQGEVTQNEIRVGRTKQPKYIEMKGRAVAPWQAIQGAIDEAYSKFDDETPSLLVVSNDLFVGLEHAPDAHTGQALYNTDLRVGARPRDFPALRLPAPCFLRPRNLPNLSTGYFTDSRFENLGGVGILIVDSDGFRPVCYDMRLYLNGFVLPSARLPQDFVKAFKGCRLWNDPTESDSGRREKRLGESERLNRDKILLVLAAAREILERFGVRSLRLFGSAARGENDAASDLDFVVELEPETFANYMGLTEYLEDLFGCRVDLVMEDTIKPALRESIIRECVDAARL